jgi:predicted RNA methylase
MMEATDSLGNFAMRHGIESAATLTVCDDVMAGAIAERLAPRVQDKIVVEIGGGVGVLAFHLALYAKRVYCIEANPLWSSCFVQLLFERKPRNVSYLFGAASEFADQIKADVAVFCSHSGISSMMVAGRLFASDVIDVYGEMIDAHPERFDPLARMLRPHA